MVLYKCTRCGHQTDRKSSIIIHFKRKNLCKAVLKDIDRLTLFKINSITVPEYVNNNVNKNVNKMLTKTIF